MNLRLASNSLILFLFGIQIFTPAQAEVSFLKLKGMSEVFSDQCQTPVDGFRVIKTEALANSRLAGRFGPIDNRLGCNSQITEDNYGRDCPQDWVSVFLQNFFPSANGVNLVANQGSRDDLYSKMPWESLGRLWALITEEQKEDHRHSIELSDKWISKVFQVFFFQEAAQERTSLTKKHSYTESNWISSLKSKPNWERAKREALVLNHALEQERLGESLYIPRILEKSIMAYAWQRAIHKEDFLVFAKQNPPCVNPRAQEWVLADPETSSPKQTLKREEWIKKEYHPSEYLHWKKTLRDQKPSSHQLHSLFQDPEFLAFLIYSSEAVDRPLPRLAGGSESAHKGLGKNEKNGRKYNLYSDCGETALRNFFNILLFNLQERIFDVSFLNEIRKKYGLTFPQSHGKRNPKGLIPYYTGHREQNPESKEFIQSLRNIDPTQVDDVRVRDDFSRRVASGVPDGHYLKGNAKCEMAAGVSNVLTIIDGLLGDPVLHAAESPIEKWNRICQLFSRKGFQLDWTVKGGKKTSLNRDTGIVLEFSINKNPAFTWEFGTRHFSVQAASEHVEWRKEAVTQITHDAGLVPREADPERVLQWFVSSESLQSIYQTFPYAHWIWAFPVRDTHHKPDALRFLFRNHLKPYYSFIDNWVRTMPLEDDETLARLNAVYADFGYPLGNDQNHPGIIPRTLNYLPQDPRETEKLFGQAIARSLGPVIKDPYGKYWGSPVRDKFGAIGLYSWEEGLQSCLSLNIHFLDQAFSETLHQANKISEDEDRATALEKINLELRTKKQSRCILPEAEDWKVLKHDLSREKGRYFAQYLPELISQIFWSGTRSKKKSDKVKTFFGESGELAKAYPFESKAIRCLCFGPEN